MMIKALDGAILNLSARRGRAPLLVTDFPASAFWAACPSGHGLFITAALNQFEFSPVVRY
jgi:hypothetical protein